MLLVTGIPTEIGEASSFEGVDGLVVTHPVTVVHNTDELAKARPFGEFFNISPALVPAFRAALSAKKPLSFHVREQALPGGKHGQWIKRVVREIVE